jgi:hypothetical protein
MYEPKLRIGPYQKFSTETHLICGKNTCLALQKNMCINNPKEQISLFNNFMMH